jgi:hypothetical protein
MDEVIVKVAAILAATILGRCTATNNKLQAPRRIVKSLGNSCAPIQIRPKIRAI